MRGWGKRDQGVGQTQKGSREGIGMLTLKPQRDYFMARSMMINELCPRIFENHGSFFVKLTSLSSYLKKKNLNIQSI